VPLSSDDIAKVASATVNKPIAGRCIGGQRVAQVATSVTDALKASPLPVPLNDARWISWPPALSLPMPPLSGRRPTQLPVSLLEP